LLEISKEIKKLRTLMLTRGEVEMLAAERRARILQEVSNTGAVKISHLARALAVSEVTIRRDIESLTDRGLVDKVHGGVTANSLSSIKEPPFAINSRKLPAEKSAIAKVAAGLVQPGQSIALLGGSTVFSLAQRLLDVPSLTIVTNSVPISNLFAQNPRVDQTVVLAGGLRTPTDSLVGSITSQVFGRFNLDYVFLGTHGMDEEFGFSSPNLIEGETNREVINRARKMVVLVDHTKWGQRGFSSYAPLELADIVITSEGLGQDAERILRSKVQDVRLARSFA
jgi:DeoR/GlpR family transcriptional regulator of sugar metabolism